MSRRTQTGILSRWAKRDTEPFLRGNPLRIAFDGRVKTLVETIMKRGLAHHYVGVHADLKEALQALCEAKGIEPLVVG